MEKETKTKKVFCPKCGGNGYIRLPQKPPNKEQIAQCVECNQEGEIDENQMDPIYVDDDGTHRMQ